MNADTIIITLLIYFSRNPSPASASTHPTRPRGGLHMRYITTIHPTLRRAMSTSPGPGVGEVEIGVRYDVDCSTENPVSYGVRIRVLVKVLQDMELNRPLYYFTVLGMVRGLNFMRTFYLGGSLMFGPTLQMGTFMALKGIVLHSMARLIYEARGRISSIGFISGLPGITQFQPALSFDSRNPGIW